MKTSQSTQPGLFTPGEELLNKLGVPHRSRKNGFDLMAECPCCGRQTFVIHAQKGWSNCFPCGYRASSFEEIEKAFIGQGKVKPKQDE